MNGFRKMGHSKKKGKYKIVAIVINDTYAFDFPARYFIYHETIDEIVSYTATYVGQVRKGERIEAVGYIEQGSDGKKDY